MSVLAFLDIGFSEMLVVAFVALILFGGRLPEVMRTLGTSYRKFRRGMDDMTRQVTRPDLGLDLRKLAEPYRPVPPASTKPPPRVATPPPGPLDPLAPDPSPVIAGPGPGVVATAEATAPIAGVPPPSSAASVRVEDDTPHV